MEFSQLDERPDAILIAGPTTSGKSSLALELAKKWNGVIINADSMQVYPHLRVLTARPDDGDLEKVRHFLYGHASLSEPYSVAQWLDDVRDVLDTAKRQGKIPVFAGGTGLYFKVLIEGLADIPDIPSAIRNRWREKLSRDGLASVREELQRRDPAAADTLGAGDRQRILRALEVIDATGQSILELQSKAGSAAILPPENVCKYLLLVNRKECHQRIDRRFDIMLETGAINEVRSLLELDIPSDHPVLKAIGVQQIKDFLEGNISLQMASEKSKTATRQYAKRQSTWFRNQLGDDWVVFN